MKRKLFSIILVVIILPALFFLNKTSIVNTVRTQTLSVIKPCLELSQFIFKNFTEGVFRLTSQTVSYDEYDMLERKFVGLKQELVAYKEMKKENERLRRLLNFKRSVPGDPISALIIGRDTTLLSHWIILNRGSEDGIKKDMYLIAPGGLVGRVLSVGVTTARALLLTDRQSKVSALVQESRDIGIIEGEGRKFLKLRYLDIDCSAKIGDTVVTSGLGGVYPKGVPVGTIMMIAREPNGLHLYARVKPFVDFSKLEEIICLEESA